MRRIIVEYEKCDGCKNCSAACMQAHRKTPGTIYDLDLTDPENESRNYILKETTAHTDLCSAGIVTSRNA